MHTVTCSIVSPFTIAYLEISIVTLFPGALHHQLNIYFLELSSLAGSTVHPDLQ